MIICTRWGSSIDKKLGYHITINILKSVGYGMQNMSLELDHWCPDCEEDRTFYRAASTVLHLGEKVKWRCPVCGYSFVTIGDSIDTSTTE